jgi:hypothetical protein
MDSFQNQTLLSFLNLTAFDVSPFFWWGKDSMDKFYLSVCGKIQPGIISPLKNSKFTVGKE